MSSQNLQAVQFSKHYLVKYAFAELGKIHIASKADKGRFTSLVKYLPSTVRGWFLQDKKSLSEIIFWDWRFDGIREEIPGNNDRQSPNTLFMLLEILSAIRGVTRQIMITLEHNPNDITDPDHPDNPDNRYDRFDLYDADYSFATGVMLNESHNVFRIHNEYYFGPDSAVGFQSNFNLSEISNSRQTVNCKMIGNNVTPDLPVSEPSPGGADTVLDVITNTMTSLYRNKIAALPSDESVERVYLFGSTMETFLTRLIELPSTASASGHAPAIVFMPVYQNKRKMRVGLSAFTYNPQGRTITEESHPVDQGKASVPVTYELDQQQQIVRISTTIKGLQLTLTAADEISSALRFGDL